MTSAPGPATCCTMCGRPADPALDGDPPLLWTAEVADPGRGDPNGAVTYVCPDCTRRHVRAIEAKLDQQWW
ncbi:hypothetical protein [Jatrophihabitans fulvus]